MKGTRGTETSNYPEEKKVKTIPKVVASEIGRAQRSCRNTALVSDAEEILAEQVGKPDNKK